MLKMKRSLVVELAVLALVAGCGDTVEEISEQLIDEMCDAAFKCCSRAELDYLVGPFTDEGNCVGRLKNTAELAQSVEFQLPLEGFGFALPNITLLDKVVEDGRAEFNESGVSACLSALRDIECNPVEPIPEEEPDGCVPPAPPEENPCAVENLVRGTLGQGEDCSSPGFSIECKEGLTCVQIASLGEFGVCVNPGSAGDFCFADSECKDDLFCNVLEGECATPRELGETCLYANPDDLTPPADSTIIDCGEGLLCDPVLDICVEPCQQGARCVSDDGCDTDQGLSCIAGRCDTPRPLGLQCNVHADCAEGLQCAANPANPSENLCQEKLEDGGTCFEDVVCVSDFCNTILGECAATVAVGGGCPTFDSDQCTDGYCEYRNVNEITFANTFVNGFCNSDDDCPGTAACDTQTFRCEALCIGLAADGVSCVFNEECQSEACIGSSNGVSGVCGSLPLADGQACNSSFQCESEFCHPGTSLCATPPLPNGEECLTFQNCGSFGSCPTGMVCNQEIFRCVVTCDSGVCDPFLNQCTAGLAEGSDCTDSSAVCGADLYCNRELSPPVCDLKLDPGAECNTSAQCHGQCAARFGRLRCDLTPAPDTATCDGL